MKKTEKTKAVLLILASILVALSASCSKPAYRTDISPSDLADSAAATLRMRGALVPMGASYLFAVFDLSGVEYTDFTVLRAEDISSDEFGIFRCRSEEEAKRLAGHLNDELDDLREDWDDRYFPEEKHKIDNARAEAYGVTVVYTVLSKEEQEGLISAVKAALSE